MKVFFYIDIELLMNKCTSKPQQNMCLNTTGTINTYNTKNFKNFKFISNVASKAF